MKAASSVSIAAILGVVLAVTAGCATRSAYSGKQLLIDGQTLASLLPESERRHIKNSIPERFQGDALVAEALGQLLEEHQQTAVEASNLYIAKLGGRHPHLDGWLVVRENDTLKVLFITRRNATPYVTATASNVSKDGARIKTLKTPRALNPRETALWKARALAFQAKMTTCSRQYNPVVVPVTAAGVNEIFVYLLPLAPSDRIMLGGYYRIRINAQGTQILNAHAFTHACLEMHTRPGAVGASVTEVKSPTPTAPQVYANLRYKLPVFVTTTGNQLRWKIEQGRISLLSKPVRQ